MFSSDKNVETIGQLVEVLKHYIGLKSEYIKLDVVDKVVRLLTALTIGALLLALLALAVIYLSFAAAYALEDVVGLAPAFCIVAGAYLLILVIFIVFRFIFRKQWIEKPLVKFLASLLMQN